MVLRADKRGDGAAGAGQRDGGRGRGGVGAAEGVAVAVGVKVARCVECGAQALGGGTGVQVDLPLGVADARLLKVQAVALRPGVDLLKLARKGGGDGGGGVQVGVREVRERALVAKVQAGGDAQGLRRGGLARCDKLVKARGVRRAADQALLAKEYPYA